MTRFLVLLAALGACKGKAPEPGIGSSTGSSGSSTGSSTGASTGSAAPSTDAAATPVDASPADAPAIDASAAMVLPPAPPFGSMAVKYDDEETVFKIGAAIAIPEPWEDGSHYTFVIYNSGVPSAPCVDPLNQEKAIGGNHWAVSGEMSPIDDPVRATDKDKPYRALMVRFFFTHTKGDYKGDAINGVTNIDNANATLIVNSVEGDAITATIEAAQNDKGSYMRGSFKAKICKP